MICKRCSVTKGSFYHHFRSKEDLLAYWINRQIGKIDDIPEDESLSRKERLRLFYRGNAEAIEKIGADLVYHALVADVSAHGPNLLKNVTAIGALLDLTQEAIDEGEIHTDVKAADLTGCYAMAVIGAIVEWKMDNGKSDIVKNLDMQFKMVFR